MALHTVQHWREADSWARGETYKEDLPKSGLLSAILLKVTGSCVSGATLATEWWKLLDFLDKVEVVIDGSSPALSLDWKPLQFCTWLDQHKITQGWWRNYATNTQYEYLLIPFGRRLWDTRMGLDLSRYNRVDLRLTNTSSSTYHSASLSLDVCLLMLEDLPGGFPDGYLKKEEFREWTTVADKWEYIELPTKYPLRGVHLRTYPDVDANYVAETGMSNLAYDLKFGIDSRRRFLYDAGIDNLMYLDYLQHPGEPLTSGHFDKTADYGIPFEIGRVFGWAGISGAKDGAVSATIPTVEADQTHVTQKAEAREADSPVHMMVRGLCPYNCTSLLYSADADPDEMLDFARHGQCTVDVRTRNAASAADGTITCIVDQVVRD